MAREVVTLQDGDKFRLGRQSYKVEGGANVPAVLVEQDDEKKQNARRIKWICPNGCSVTKMGKTYTFTVEISRAFTDAWGPVQCPHCNEFTIEQLRDCNKKHDDN